MLAARVDFWTQQPNFDMWSNIPRTPSCSSFLSSSINWGDSLLVTADLTFVLNVAGGDVCDLAGCVFVGVLLGGRLLLLLEKDASEGLIELLVFL